MLVGLLLVAPLLPTLDDLDKLQGTWTLGTAAIVIQVDRWTVQKGDEVFTGVLTVQEGNKLVFTKDGEKWLDATYTFGKDTLQLIVDDETVVYQRKK